MHKAINAKFKKGDRVVTSDGKHHGVVWAIYGDGTVAVQCEEDAPLTRRMIDQNRLKLANCSTANSVVAKAVANARAMNSSAEPTVAKNDAMDEYEDELRELQREIDKCYRAFATPVEQAIKAADSASSILSQYMSKFEVVAKAAKGDDKDDMLGYARIGRDIVKAIARAGQQIAEIGKSVKREVY